MEGAKVDHLPQPNSVPPPPFSCRLKQFKNEATPPPPFRPQHNIHTHEFDAVRATANPLPHTHVTVQRTPCRGIGHVSLGVWRCPHHHQRAIKAPNSQAQRRVPA